MVIQEPFLLLRKRGMVNKMNEIIRIVILGTIILIPFLLTGWNIVISVRFFRRKKECRLNKWVEFAAVIIGLIYMKLYALLGEINYVSWDAQLYNNERHSMIAPEGGLTIAVLFAVSFLCYIIIRLWPSLKQPPLVSAFGIGGIYLGIGVSLMFCIQTFPHFFFILVPANYILILIKTIFKLVWEKKDTVLKQRERKHFKSFFQLLEKSSNLPLLGLVAMIPILGITIIVLLLFGQEPDSIIKAWTDTAEWNLSQRIAPQNLTYDEHYLCTVAAGGHPGLVKPIRPGIRHGHPVIVNRQLCIANAFEQVLEEKLPRFHKVVRGTYDRIGYPISKKIRSRYIADVIYLLMKPLEWFFLLVLYAVDVRPEDRIALQYPHAPLPAKNDCGICKE